MLLVVLAAGTAAASSGGAARGTLPPRVAFVIDPVALAGSPSAFTVALDGFRSARRRLAIRGDIVYVAPNEDAGTALRNAARRGYALVVSALPEPETVERVARAFPRVRFLMLDVPVEALDRPEANVTGTVFRAEEAGYLAGYLAASMADREPAPHVVSAVGGTAFPPVTRWIVGYRAGARHADPHISVRVAYSGDYVDEAKCARIARLQVAAGSRVVYDVAGACGVGALTAARAAGAFAIGVDVDQSYLGPQVLTSTLLRLDAGVVGSLERFVHGALPSGRDQVFDLAGGGVALAPLSARVPPVVARRVAAVRRALIAGRIRVPHVI